VNLTLKDYLEIKKKIKIKKKAKIYLVVILKFLNINLSLIKQMMNQNHLYLEKLMINQIKKLNLLDLVLEEVSLEIKIKVILDLNLIFLVNKIQQNHCLARLLT